MTTTRTPAGHLTTDAIIEATGRNGIARIAGIERYGVIEGLRYEGGYPYAVFTFRAFNASKGEWATYRDLVFLAEMVEVL